MTWEGVQSIYEPRELTSWASWSANWAPRQLKSSSYFTRAYVSKPGNSYSTSNILIYNNKYLAFISTESLFFEKSQHDQKFLSNT